jgi:hypothetical protein
MYRYIKKISHFVAIYHYIYYIYGTRELRGHTLELHAGPILHYR